MRITSQPTQRLGGTGALRNRTGLATRTGLMTARVVLRTVVPIPDVRLARIRCIMMAP
jgi:hypothetical protein